MGQLAVQCAQPGHRWSPHAGLLNGPFSTCLVMNHGSGWYGPGLHASHREKHVPCSATIILVEAGALERPRDDRSEAICLSSRRAGTSSELHTAALQSSTTHSLKHCCLDQNITTARLWSAALIAGTHTDGPVRDPATRRPFAIRTFPSNGFPNAACLAPERDHARTQIKGRIRGLRKTV